MMTRSLLLAAAVLVGPAAARAAPLTDAQVAGALAESAHAQSETAALAEERAGHRDVLYFARLAGREAEATRRRLLVMLARGLEPADSDCSGSLRHRARETLTGLRGAHGAAFERAYLEAAAADEGVLLELLEERLIPAAKDPDLAAMLAKKRRWALRRLEEARLLAARLEERARPSQP